MPTFKADFAQYNPKKSTLDNLQALFAEYNDLVQLLSRTVNNLDEENLNISLTQQKGGSEHGELGV